MIRCIFLTIDRKYAISSNNTLSLWDMGLESFKNNIILQKKVFDRVTSSLLSLIKRERMGENILRNETRNLIHMLISLNLYQQFESLFLKETETFYFTECQECINSLSPSSLLNKIEQRLSDENERVINYLSITTRVHLINILERIWIKDSIDMILTPGLESLIENNKPQDLNKMYILIARVDLLVKMKDCWKDYIKKAGTKIMNNEEPNNLVESIIAFHDNLVSLLKDSFENNNTFYNALKDGFHYFINTKRNTPGELLAKFIDKKLRSKKSNTISDIELDQLLDKVMTVFRYIDGKDMFEAFYKKTLAKRLLLKKSVSMDAEKSLIMRLKSECGSDFTQRLEGMLKDIELSKELTNQFKEETQGETKIEMDLSILTTSIWPNFKPIHVVLSNEMTAIQELVTKFYTKNHRHRSLSWLHTHGFCTMRALFPKGRKELTVSTFQAIILSLFNISEKKTYEEIEAETGIDDKDELNRNVLSLLKYKILIKEPKTTSLELSDSFKVNNDFKSKLYRITVNKIQMKETKKENVKTVEDVFVDRQYQIDASIVRIMKSRNVLSHNELIQEIYNQLKFPCDVLDIKKRIEVLIEREYIARSPDDSAVYTYIA